MMSQHCVMMIPDESRSPSPVYGNFTHPYSTEGGAFTHVKWSYHPKTIGMFIQIYIISYCNEFLGMPCDINGNYIDPSMPPPPHHPTTNPDNWTPCIW